MVFFFPWERILADRKHLLEGTDEEVEKKRDSASKKDNQASVLMVNSGLNTHPAAVPQWRGSAVIPPPKATNDKGKERQI